MSATILVIDDEKNIREGLAAALELEDYTVFLADNGKSGMEIFKKHDIDVVITDLRMNEMSGEQVLEKVMQKSPTTSVIILTGHGSIDSAVEAMRNGAHDFLTKPVNLDQLTLIIKRALKGRRLELEHKELLDEVEKQKSFKNIVSKSSEMDKVLKIVQKTSNTKSSVLITGETGVGKELIADALHNLSSRKDKPFIKVHCAALSETLLESELFGHEKGSFTGATGLKKGRFELANGGTIFLDEIGEIDQNVQIKILRVLQEKQFERVGGEHTINCDVRVIAATNRDLETEVKEGRFREDLYYRLNVVNIFVPPLRNRKDDIPLLATSFLNEFSQENEKAIDGIDAQTRKILYDFNWPGNIRQLRNCIESAVVMCSGNIITQDDLPPTIVSSNKKESVYVPIGIPMEEAEKIIIVENLSRNNGNKTKTADILGIGRKTLHRKLEDYGVQ